MSIISTLSSRQASAVEAAGEDVPRVQEASARLAAAVAAVGEVPAAGGEFA